MYKHGYGRRARKKRPQKMRVLLTLAIVVLLLAGLVFALILLLGQKNDGAPLPSITPGITPGGMDALPTPTLTPPPSATPPANDPSASIAQPDDWRLVVVNPWNPLPDGYEVAFTQLKNEQSVDTRCYADLQSMMDDCRQAGLSPLICSSYRTQEKQQQLFDNKVAKLVGQGQTEEQAKAEAAKVIAPPGTSEHQLGLAVDIVDTENQNLDDTQEKTPVQQWLVQNCHKYGFILRYPADKTEVTGISYESWHYRYVGREYAQAMADQKLCLEEFIRSLS